MSHHSSSQYYQKRIEIEQSELEQLRKRIHLLGTIRLGMVVVAAFLLYHFRGCGAATILLILFLFLVPFLWLIWKHNELFRKKRYLETSIVSDKNELKSLNYDFSAFDGASDQIDANHPFTLDLDIFGNNSLFQSLNRTCTVQGRKILSDWLKEPLQSKKAILKRQDAVRELGEQPEQIHRFIVTGKLRPGRKSDLKELDDFACIPAFFTSNAFWKVLCVFIPCAWLVLIGSVVLGWVSPMVLSWMFIFTLALSESQYRKVNRLLKITGRKMETFSTYSDLMKIVENSETQTELLSDLRKVFFSGDQKASVSIKKLSRLLGDLDQRSNLMVHMVFNPLVLWDIRKSIAIENWKEKYRKDFSHWINALGTYDALCSLAVFDFNHPDYLYPEISSAYFELVGEDLGHPLMNLETCVLNDVRIASAPDFMVVTGANMAGKSTYLRVVGVNYLLACMGAPVFARFFRIYPAGLVTSLRTSDSLTNHESYFFAELKRLKMIIDDLQSGKERFILLDEILKGTNSVDKQKGSLALVQQLIRLKTCGIIATHDLVLGSLEEKFPDCIRNYCFEAEIRDDELSFSYKIKTGIATNMNACFLMEKMGITI